MLRIPILLFMIFFTSLCFAHDPIVPWPLNSDRQYIVVADIEGSWCTIDSDDYCFSIYASASSIWVALHTQGEPSNISYGSLIENDMSLSTNLSNESNHLLRMSLTRSHDKFYLRLQYRNGMYRTYEIERR